MKLHSLEITGMGPYAGKVEIDFDALDRAGVYLLSGPTGSGKTTVLDAISYALFGEIPRQSKGSEVVSDHRETTTTPEVRLEVTIAGEQLRVTRIPEHERPKTRGEGTTSQNQSLVVERHSDGDWNRITSNWSEGNTELAGRIGMNASQFSQVVMLPQGDFARFLQAKSSERQDLLEQLFPGADLTWMENWLKDRAISDRQAREAKEQEIADCFQTVKTSVPANEDGEVELPEQTEAVPALAWVEATREALVEIDAACEKQRAEAATLAQAAEAELKKLEDEADRVRRRAAAEEEKTELTARSKWREETGEVIAWADRAAAVLGLAHAAEQRRSTTEKAMDEAKQLGRALADNELTSGVDPDKYAETKSSFENSITTIANFERDELPGRRELTEKIKGLEEVLAGAADTGPESPVGKAEAAVASCAQLVQEARKHYIAIRDARTRGMAAELARGLEPGQPCVVCGSTEHPSPAHGDAVEYTAEDEQAADEAVAAAVTAESESREELARIKSEIAERKAATEAELAGARKIVSTLAAREEELADGAASVTARREQLEKAVELIDGLISAVKSAENCEVAAKQATSEAADAAASAGFKSTAEALEAAREEPVLKGLKSEADAHDKKLAIVNERLEGELAGVDPKKVIDTEPARQKAAAAGAERDEKTSRAGVARNNLENFRRETDPVPGLYDELGPLREAAGRSAELDRLAGGRNDRKMKLSIYVLATRLRQVIRAANFHFEQMSNQRYELLYTGDRAGNAMAGLGIEVFDAHTSETRPVSTLSGGESFCASLALALGLAEVVQGEAGGRSIETLFIDEGFGTLDSKSLDQVMDVIDGLRERGRSVGLVSHVEELRNRIPARIEVESSRRGSTLSVTTD